MGHRRLIWLLFPSYLLITCLSLLAVALYSSAALREFFRQRTEEELLARARLVGGQVLAPLVAGDGAEVDRLCKLLGRQASMRVTVVLPSGEVIGDSESAPAEMDHHGDRPEIAAALAGDVGRADRFSNTVRTTMLYRALPCTADGKTVGVVRTALAETAIDRALRGVLSDIAVAGVLIALAATAVSVLVARRIAGPIEELKRGADRFARGELERRLRVQDTVEFAGLAEAMNQMAAQLDDRIRTAIAQRNELEAVLTSMVEGVLAVDTEERILRINQAAADLLGVDAGQAQGRSIQEVVRNVDLLRFVAQSLAGASPVESDIALNRGEGAARQLQAHGTLLRDTEGRSLGALVVLNDVTRLRKLEGLRRDFVTSVSHELRTPITSIKGFVETLLDGAIEHREDALRFLGIIARQTDRLKAILDDLLSLSRVEEQAERAEIPLAIGSVREVLLSAVEVCRPRADTKSVGLEVSCPESLQARINAQLLEQAMVNLIDNAIKYSESGQQAQVEAREEADIVVLEVRDHGCGIPPEHLPRVFERFYRVDKSRSRTMGGTGLGLAIVKHIAQAHGGQVEVESEPGSGSVFRVRIASCRAAAGE